MLPRANRLTRPEDFRRTIRAGKTARRGSLVMHALVPGGPADPHGLAIPARLGLTISKAVGGSVVRHRVARVLRHAMAEELSMLPAGSTWVIRALPDAGGSDADARVRRDVRSAVAEILTT